MDRSFCPNLPFEAWTSVIGCSRNWSHVYIPCGIFVVHWCSQSRLPRWIYSRLSRWIELHVPRRAVKEAIQQLQRPHRCTTQETLICKGPGACLLWRLLTVFDLPLPHFALIAFSRCRVWKPIHTTTLMSFLQCQYSHSDLSSWRYYLCASLGCTPTRDPL